MDAKHILSKKGGEVFTIACTALLAEVVKILTEKRVGALIVTDANGGLMGIVSERDIVQALDQRGIGALTSPVADIMTRRVVTCIETASDVEILTQMTEGPFRHMPVVKNQQLAGIVSIGDVVKLRLEELESKLNNIEAITAAIAHEVKQPLAAIAINCSAALRFLQRNPIDRDEVEAALNRIVSDCHRTREVFDSIRALFRAADRERQPVDVNQIIVEVLASLRNELDARGVVTRPKLMSGLPPIEGHAGQLQQVIQNLVRNAMEAMEATVGRARMLYLVTELHGSQAIKVALEDSGTGFVADQADRIFEPYVTTKAQGMGLGLAICRAIVEQHGGQLTASSDGKSGALFQLVLPIVRPGMSEAAPEEGSQA
jgi:signal transduction histidine kinase